MSIVYFIFSECHVEKYNECFCRCCESWLRVTTVVFKQKVETWITTQHAPILTMCKWQRIKLTGSLGKSFQCDNVSNDLGQTQTTYATNCTTATPTECWTPLWRPGVVTWAYPNPNIFNLKTDMNNCAAQSDNVLDTSIVTIVLFLFMLGSVHTTNVDALLSPSSWSLRNNRSISAWASRGTSYIIRAAFFLDDIKFL